MVSNCKSCPHWWLCAKNRDKCEFYQLPEEVACNKDELLEMALHDLTELMIAGKGNMDLCDLCVSEVCAGRGGDGECVPRYRGRLAEDDS